MRELGLLRGFTAELAIKSDDFPRILTTGIIGFFGCQKDLSRHIDRS